MKPLLITDCDEVLLHMIRHYGAWLGEHHDIELEMGLGDFSTMMKRRDGSPPPTREQSWELINGFFPAEMHRQTLVPHAREALSTLAERAEIVVLTNLADDVRQARIDQLLGHGIAHRVQTNSGGKGEPVARLVEEHGNPVTVFVDDLPTHHDSVARYAPGVWRLHMVAEPSLGPFVAKASAAHARIDDWREATRWIAARFDDGRAAQ